MFCRSSLDVFRNEGTRLTLCFLLKFCFTDIYSTRLPLWLLRRLEELREPTLLSFRIWVESLFFFDSRVLTFLSSGMLAFCAAWLNPTKRTLLFLVELLFKMPCEF